MLNREMVWVSVVIRCKQWLAEFIENVIIIFEGDLETWTGIRAIGGVLYKFTTTWNSMKDSDWMEILRFKIFIFLNSNFV